MRHIIALLGAAAMVELAGVRVASADAVPGPPTCCPAGSKPETCHGGPHCSPLTCVTNADCTDGGVCKDMAYCVSEISCDGWRPPDAAPPKYFAVVRSECSGTCASNEWCDTLKVCVTEAGCSPSASSGGVSGDTGSCSCTVPAEAFGGRLSAAALAALASVFAGTAVGRRWRRSRR